MWRCGRAAPISSAGARNGLSGWSYEDALPYYRKMEAADYGDWDLHGRNGPVRISRVPDRDLTPAHRAFAEACALLGFDAVDDLVT